MSTVDSKAVAVVTEGLEVLRGERRIFYLFFFMCVGFFCVWGGGEVYLRILSMSGSVCLPACLPGAPALRLRNLLQGEINEDLVLDCHLLSPPRDGS